MDHHNADTASVQDQQSAKNNSSTSDRNGDHNGKKNKTDTPTKRCEEDTTIVSLVVIIFDGNQHLNLCVRKQIAN